MNENPVYVVGIGASLPSYRYTNRELAPYFNCDDETADRYAEATGVHLRHSVVDFADGPRQKVLNETLAHEAGQIALDGAGMGPEDVDAVVTACTGLDYLMPSLSSRLLKLFDMSPKQTFDLYGGCAEFLVGVNLATNLVRSGTQETVLITASEALTSFARQMRFPVDAFIFGDGGGAWVITSRPRNGSQPVFELKETFSATMGRYEGDASEIIVHPIAGSKEPLENFHHDDRIDPRMEACSPDVDLTSRWTHNAKFARRIAPSGMLEAFKNVTENTSVNSGYVIPHQGTQPVLDATRELMPDGWTIVENIRERGNMSTVCVPMAAYENLDTLEKVDDIVCTVVGVGFTYAGARLKRVA